MQHHKSVPDPVLLQVLPLGADRDHSINQAQSGQLLSPQSIGSATDPRTQKIEEFLAARSVSAKTQKSYRQDLQHLLRWTAKSWEEIGARDIAIFRADLLRIAHGKRLWSDATVRRILGTLKAFYGWMVEVGHLDRNPAQTIQLPKQPAPVAKSLTEAHVATILEATTSLPFAERNVALIGVLQAGVQAEVATHLNLENYDRADVSNRLSWSSSPKAEQTLSVTLSQDTADRINAYLDWRQTQGEILTPDRPLFISHSRRNQGDRISYDTIRKLINKLETITELSFNAGQLRHSKRQ